jgi:hypothetical protein
MMVFGSELEKSVSDVSALELKQLLMHLCKASNTNFRFRIVGEMWMKHLMQVTAVSDKTFLVFDDVETKYYLVKFNNIMQFEIDNRFQAYQPFFHYDVKPSVELD